MAQLRNLGTYTRLRLRLSMTRRNLRHIKLRCHMKSLKKLRQQAFLAQSKLCYYCNLPMWEENKNAFRKKHSLTEKMANHFKCTAEHLTARCDGGSDTKTNIVAACITCNKRRHQRKTPLSPAPYKKHVVQRISRKKWHVKRAFLMTIAGGG